MSEILSLKAGDEIFSHEHPFGPAIAVVASATDGRVVIVRRTNAEDRDDDLRRMARAENVRRAVARLKRKKLRIAIARNERAG